jgi:hypothetical protein
MSLKIIMTFYNFSMLTYRKQYLYHCYLFYSGSSFYWLEVTRLKEPRFPYPKFDLLIQVWLCIYIRKWHIQQGNYVRFPLFINSLNTFFTNNYIHRSKYFHTKIFPYIFHIKPQILDVTIFYYHIARFDEKHLILCLNHVIRKSLNKILWKL